jgi:hypothetical protein
MSGRFPAWHGVGSAGVRFAVNMILAVLSVADIFGKGGG